MVLTSAITDRPLFEGRMLEMLKTETRLTSRVGALPDDYSFSKQGWRREKVDLDAIIFDAAEYVKDGLIPITEWLGKSPWSERALRIVDDIWANAPIETPFGKIPTLNFEVNGDLLQACSRLYWFTGDRKYLDWAIRLGDYYLLGTNHPTRDLKTLCLGDHSCEVINGLSELYAACATAAPEKREAYRKPLHELYDTLLKVACDPQGFFYLNVDLKTGKQSTALTDNWGYNYDGFYTVFLLDGKTEYRDAVRKTLGNLKAYHTGKGGMCQSGSADGYADSIEGAITLLNREWVPSAAEWADAEIRTMWGKQKADGVIEGWHGDGNSARTSIMYTLWKTQGILVRPWREDVRFGAVKNNGVVYLYVIADKPWTGTILFDKPRHKLNMHLPLDYPRINQFPEWFVVEPELQYELQDGTSGTDVQRYTQKADGVIEGWHGDGNSARTSIMYTLWKTQGILIRPWREDVRFGAVRTNGVVYLTVLADKPWSGVVLFDKPRHKLNMHLPLDYPRINQFPEWFTVEPELSYAVNDCAPGKDAQRYTGKEMIQGIPVKLEANKPLFWRIKMNDVPKGMK